MGLKYADWARLVAMTSAIWTIWGSIWSFFYRKFFWDMIGGTMGPQGLEAPASSDFFITIIVKFPVVQIGGIITGLSLLALDWPLPLLQNTPLHASHCLRISLLFVHSFLSIILYQSADSAIVALLAMAIYTKSWTLREEIRERPRPAKRNNPV